MTETPEHININKSAALIQAMITIEVELSFIFIRKMMNSKTARNEIKLVLFRFDEFFHRAAAMGQNGAHSVAHIQWHSIASTLVRSVDATTGARGTNGAVVKAGQRRPNVAVLDMQPIAPAVGGGRLRLLGLYHALGVPTTYVGTYDWPGPGHRDHQKEGRNPETRHGMPIPVPRFCLQAGFIFQSFFDRRFSRPPEN